MSVLVFDGPPYSILLDLDFCVATDASVRPVQFPDFLSRPANPNSEPLVLPPFRSSHHLQLDAAIFSNDSNSMRPFSAMTVFFPVLPEFSLSMSQAKVKATFWKKNETDRASSSEFTLSSRMSNLIT